MSGGAASPSGSRARNLRRAGCWLVIAIIAVTVIVPVVLGGREALAATLHFSPRGYLAILALIVASWICRARKLQLLLRRFEVPSTFGTMLLVSLATDFAFMTTPGGVGGYAASVYYLRRAGASTSGATTITAADQGMDVLFFTVALPIAGLALIVSNAIRSDALSMIAFATSALIVLAFVAALSGRHQLGRWFAALSFSGRPRLHRAHFAATTFLATLRADAQLVRAGGPGFLFNIFALTVLQQLTRYGVLWLTLWLLGHPVAFLPTFLLQVFVLQAATWTGVPSGAGGAEIGLTATLAAWVPGPSLATALLLWRLATLHVGLIAGSGAIALLARPAKRPVSGRDPAATDALHGVLK